MTIGKSPINFPITTIEPIAYCIISMQAFVNFKIHPITTSRHHRHLRRTQFAPNKRRPAFVNRDSIYFYDWINWMVKCSRKHRKNEKNNTQQPFLNNQRDWMYWSRYFRSLFSVLHFDYMHNWKTSTFFLFFFLCFFLTLISIVDSVRDAGKLKFKKKNNKEVLKFWNEY